MFNGQRAFYFESSDRKIWNALFLLTMVFLVMGSYKLSFPTNSSVLIWNRKMWNEGYLRLPCMLLLCVCWWKWCDVDPTMLLLLLELVELLSGLGVAIVVLDSGSSAQAAMQRVKLRPLCLQSGHCATWTQQLHHGHVCAAAAFTACRKYCKITTSQRNYSHNSIT